MLTGTGPAAAMSYPTGVHYKVPHGIGGAIFLPHVIRYNINNGIGFGDTRALLFELSPIAQLWFVIENKKYT